MTRVHKHILIPKAQILKRKANGFRDEPVYLCEICTTEFAEIPRYELEVPK